MSVLDLSIDALLTTTRSVRKRLDLSRPVEPEVIRECLDIALQAPTGGNSQDWHFVVVTDPELRQALATLYRKGAARYVELMTPVFQQRMATSSQEAKARARMIDSGQYLSEHLHEVPVHVIPCIQGRTDQLPIVAQCFAWGRFCLPP
ncbi:MAG: nitroreductase family protein, partial [Chloroflexi bacterium]|nr:nitroreductase family protein [Chloroflexota bacterium]